MFTNEKVLVAFWEYLEADEVCEVVQTIWEYTVMEWNVPCKEWYNV